MADQEQGDFDPKETGTEFKANMTNDGAPGSHSELFGLAKKDGDSGDTSDSGPDSSKDGPTPAPAQAQTNDGSGPTPPAPETKTGGMADGSSDNSLPGAGSTQATADQGSGKVNPEKESVLDKVNPLK